MNGIGDSITRVECDVCKYNFVLKTDAPIKEQAVYIGDERITVQYFVCPRCHKVYVVAIYDAMCLQLLEKYNKVFVQCQKMYASATKRKGVQVGFGFGYWQSQLNAASKAYKGRMQKVKSKYNGTFTVTPDGELLYEN